LDRFFADPLDLALFRWFLASNFVGKLVSLLSLFFRFEPCDLLHLFFFFFFSDLNPAITLAARCLRWRARVRIASAPVRWWRFATNLWELLEIALNLCVFCFCLALWVQFNGEFEVFCEIVLNWCWNWARVHESSWDFCGFWSVTAKRERKWILLVMWLRFYGSSFDWYSNRPYIGCHVASGPMETWHLDWYLLAWHLD